jgi:hypothetical protein
MSYIIFVQHATLLNVYHRFVLVTISLICCCSIGYRCNTLRLLFSLRFFLCCFIQHLLALDNQRVDTVLVNVFLVGPWEIKRRFHLFIPDSIKYNLVLLCVNDSFLNFNL